MYGRENAWGESDWKRRLRATALDLRMPSRAGAALLGVARKDADSRGAIG